MIRREVNKVFRLGWPLALAELGGMTTTMVDAILIGRLSNSAEAIAAAALATSLFVPVAYFGVGLLTGVSTLVSQSAGAEKPGQGLRALAQSLWLVLLWVPFTHLLLVMGTRSLLLLDGLGARLVGDAVIYMNALVWSTAPLLLAMALRLYMQSIGRTVCVFVALLACNLVNAVGDWALLFGHLGFPALGLVGSAVATVMVRVTMLIVLAVSFVWHLRVDRVKVDSTMFVPGGELRALLKLGWAPAIQTMFDLGVSSMQDLVGGRLGALALAVNQVVLQVSSLVYYAGSGMASATTTLVGQAVGRGDPAEVRLSTRASTLLCVGWTLLTGAAFVLVPHRLAGVYTIDPSVIAATGACFAVSALLQPFDAWESCLSSALCGLGDTRTPMLAGVFWSWVVGAPLTWALAIHLHLGVLGLFLGRAVASAGTAFTVRAVWPARVRRLLARERPETAR